MQQSHVVCLMFCLLAVFALNHAFPTQLGQAKADGAKADGGKAAAPQVHLVEENDAERMRYYLERQRALQRSANTGGRVFVKDVTKRKTPSQRQVRFPGHVVQAETEAVDVQPAAAAASAAAETPSEAGNDFRSAIARAFALSGGTVHKPLSPGASYGGK